MSKRTSIGLQNKGGVRNDSNREQDRVTEREEKLKQEQERKVLWGREREKDRETEGE